MESLFVFTWLLIGFFALLSAWPLDFQDDAEYVNFRQPNTEFLGTDDENSLDSDIRSEGWGFSKPRLPRTKFVFIKNDLSNGDGGAFEFKKPTEPLIKPRAAGKTHIPTISDETPLYLNYAEKDDASHHFPSLLASLSEKTTSAPAAELSLETQDNEPESENKKFDPSVLTLPEYVQEDTESNIPEPEIDFTQRLAIPLPQEQDHEEELKVNNEEPPYPDARLSQNDAEDANYEDVGEASSDMTNSSTLTPLENQVPEVIEIIAPAPVPPHNLQAHPEIHFAPASHLDFFFGHGTEKRSGKDDDAANTTTLLVPIVAACACAAIVGTVAAALVYKRTHKKKPYTDIEDPSYGVTGPPVKPTFLDLNGDRSLAKSAETYHYQHQKQKIMSSVDNNPSSGGSTEPKSGDHSDYDTEDDDEAEDYGDYTVYECPGLAPPGDLEVVNPMFTTLKKDDSAEE